MDAQLSSFLTNSRLTLKQTSFGYTYVWRVQDELGMTSEMDMEEFNQYIGENLAQLQLRI